MADILLDAGRAPAWQAGLSRCTGAIALLVNCSRSREAGDRRLEGDVKATVDTAAGHPPVPGPGSEGCAKGSLLPDPGQAEHTPGAHRRPGRGIDLRDAERPIPAGCPRHHL